MYTYQELWIIRFNRNLSHHRQRRSQQQKLAQKRALPRPNLDGALVKRRVVNLTAGREINEEQEGRKNPENPKNGDKLAPVINTMRGG